MEFPTPPLSYVSIAAKPAMLGRQVVLRVGASIDGLFDEYDASSPSIDPDPSLFSVDIARFIQSTIDPLVGRGLLDPSVSVRYLVDGDLVAEAPFQRLSAWPRVPAAYVDRILKDAASMACGKEVA